MFIIYFPLCSQPAKFTEQDFERLVATESDHVGSLLGQVLKKEYANLNLYIGNISFDDLLFWPLWPNFIKLYGKI